jgi:hypothetical protein
LLAAPKVTKAAQLVAAAQRERIPVSKDGSYGRPPGYARSRIAARPTVSLRGGLAYDVGSDATTPEGFPYPMVLDVGQRPHIIESHGDYPLRNPRTGQVFGRRVHHPGAQPTNWCRGSMFVLRGMRL